MANQILSNARLLVGEYDLSGDANQLAIDYKAELLDDTTLGDTARSRVGGLKAFAFSAEGFWNDATDAVLFDSVGLVDVPVTILPNGQAVGDLAFLAKIATAQYSPPGGEVGDLVKFQIAGESAGLPVVRGALLELNTRTATGNGAAVDLGALAAGDRLWAALHVTGLSSGAAVTVKIQSAATSGGSYTDRITFSAASASGNRAQFLSVPGAVTDAYWRAQWTITGSTPSVGLAISAGILSA